MNFPTAAEAAAKLESYKKEEISDPPKEVLDVLLYRIDVACKYGEPSFHVRGIYDDGVVERSMSPTLRFSEGMMKRVTMFLKNKGYQVAVGELSLFTFGVCWYKQGE